MRISEEDFNNKTISDIKAVFDKIDDIQMHLNGAYELIDEQKAEIAELNQQLESAASDIEDKNATIAALKEELCELRKLAYKPKNQSDYD